MQHGGNSSAIRECSWRQQEVSLGTHLGVRRRGEVVRALGVGIGEWTLELVGGECNEQGAGRKGRGKIGKVVESKRPVHLHPVRHVVVARRGDSKVAGDGVEDCHAGNVGACACDSVQNGAGHVVVGRDADCGYVGALLEKIKHAKNVPALHANVCAAQIEGHVVNDVVAVAGVVGLMI